MEIAFLFIKEFIKYDWEQDPNQKIEFYNNNITGYFKNVYLRKVGLEKQALATRDSR